MADILISKDGLSFNDIDKILKAQTIAVLNYYQNPVNLQTPSTDVEPYHGSEPQLVYYVLLGNRGEGDQTAGDHWILFFPRYALYFDSFCRTLITLRHMYPALNKFFANIQTLKPANAIFDFKRFVSAPHKAYESNASVLCGLWCVAAHLSLSQICAFKDQTFPANDQELCLRFHHAE